MDEIALENVLRRLGRTPVKSGINEIVSPQSAPTSLDVSARKALRESMRRDFGAFILWAAKQFEELQSASRPDVLVKLLAIQDRVDDAYRKGRWPEFQAAVVEAQVLLRTREDSLPGHHNNVSGGTR